MTKHTPELNMRQQILEGTFCEHCGSISQTFMTSELEEQADTWQAAVNALAGIPDPAAFVARAKAVADACRSLNECDSPDGETHAKLQRAMDDACYALMSALNPGGAA